MHPLDRVLEALAAHGCPAKRSGEGWASRCPHHEDRNPSLSTTMGDKAVLMTCHTGCSTEDVVASLGLQMADLFLERPAAGERPSSIEASPPLASTSYDYRDADGQLVYQVVRKPGKQFRQRRPVGSEWEWNLKGVKPLLYRLPELLDEISMGSTVYVCEGEKDVEAIVAAGGVATCNSGGAGKWRPEFADILNNASRIVIVADQDAAGFAHANLVGASLNGHTNYEHVVAAKGKDAADHLAAGYGLEDFVMRVATLERPDAVVLEPEPAPISQGTPEIVTPTVKLNCARNFGGEHVEWLPGFEGFIPMRMVSMLAGLPGLGKSMFACYIAAAASQRKQRVAIAAAEDSIEHTLLPRLIANGADLDYIFFIQYTDEHGDGALHLPDHAQLLRDALTGEERYDLIILDPIGSFMGRAIDAWKATDVRAALGPLKTIAEESGAAMLVIAHLNKGKGGYLDRVSDSAAFGQIVRSGMLWARDPDDPEKEASDRRLLVSGKLNVGMRPEGHVYRIVPAYVPAADGKPPDIATARLQYVEQSRSQTDDLLHVREVQGKASTIVGEAMEHLRAYLADGPRSRREVMKAAKDDWDISRTPVDQAFERLGGISTVGGFPAKAMWSLP